MSVVWYFCGCAMCLGSTYRRRLKIDVIGWFDTGHVGSGRRLNAELVYMDSEIEFC